MKCKKAKKRINKFIVIKNASTKVYGIPKHYWMESMNPLIPGVSSRGDSDDET